MSAFNLLVMPFIRTAMERLEMTGIGVHVTLRLPSDLFVEIFAERNAFLSNGIVPDAIDVHRYVTIERGMR